MNTQEATRSTGRKTGDADLQELLVGAQQDLAATQAALASTESSRQELARQLRSMSGPGWKPRSRWSWASWVVGLLLGALAWSLVLGTAGSSEVSAAPHTPVLVVPAAAASAMANVGADADWVATLHELDGTWEQDWPRTIAVLEAFMQRWPRHAAARDKLYAALVADADLDIQSGQADAGLAELERAARLLPEREEAWVRLTAMASSGTT
jgi:hypothetical protein